MKLQTPLRETSGARPAAASYSEAIKSSLTPSGIRRFDCKMAERQEAVEESQVQIEYQERDDNRRFSGRASK